MITLSDKIAILIVAECTPPSKPSPNTPLLVCLNTDSSPVGQIALSAPEASILRHPNQAGVLQPITFRVIYTLCRVELHWIPLLTAGADHPVHSWKT